jgi:hypothetical protein
MSCVFFYVEVENRFFCTTMQGLSVDCYAYFFNAFSYASQLRQPPSGPVRVVQTVQVLDQSISVGKLLTSSSHRPKAQKTPILNLSYLLSKRANNI